jgi:asparagine synthase (glutamine-hydrolysing)
MGIHAGVFNTDGSPISREDRAWLSSVSSSGAPSVAQNAEAGFMAVWTDPGGSYRTNAAWGPDGALCLWSGRLDNRLELSSQVREAVEPACTEAHLLTAACDRWGEETFDRIMGDWSIVRWQPKSRELWLVAEFAGVTSLYWSRHGASVRWSSSLKLLASSPRRTDAWDENYFIGWLSLGPPPDRTPYGDISSVTPGTRLVFHGHREPRSVPLLSIRCGTLVMPKAEDYSRELRRLFLESVQARLAGERVIWSELSGGLDSSSIVCAATHLIREHGNGQRLEAVNHYSSLSPESNEVPFVKAVEDACGLTAHTIDIDREPLLPDLLGVAPDAPYPAEVETARRMLHAGAHTLLTGRFGDLVMGQDPFSVDALVESLRLREYSRFVSDARALARFCRTTMLDVVSASCRALRGREIRPLNKPDRPLRHESDKLGRTYSLTRAAVNRVDAIHPDYRAVARELGPTEKIRLLSGLLRATRTRTFQPKPGLGVDMAHPYLHRPLVEFILSIPVHVLCKPGETRTLMRRSFEGLVPARILTRHSKGYGAPAVVRVLRPLADRLLAEREPYILTDLGLIDEPSVRQRLKQLQDGSCAKTGNLHFLVCLEFWLRNQEGVRRRPGNAAFEAVASSA